MSLLEHAQTKGATEFAQLAKFILASGGKFSDAAIVANQKGLARPILVEKLANIARIGAIGQIGGRDFKERAAVGATTLSGNTAFADYSTVAAGFVNSLVNAGAFDGMLSSMVPVPLMSGNMGAVSVSASAYSVYEGSAKALSRISVTGANIDPKKAHCIITITQELARAPGANAVALIGREMRRAVSRATDEQFLGVLTSGLSAATSSGSSGEAIRADISNLLAAITTGQGSALFIITTALIAKRWSMATDQKGVSAFPDLTPLGGSINGITVIVSDAVTAGQVILVDASGVAAASGEITLQEFDQTSIQFDSAPDSPVTASTNIVSLWQNNEIGIRCERFFLAARLRSDAAAVVSNAASYGSGNSPP